MRSPEVYLTAQSVPDDRLKGKRVVVIDVLRASSTIVTALDNGARAVIPVGDMAEAGKIASNMGGDVTVMGGERHGLKIEGYDLGNSPLEYVQEVVQGRTVILNTTNGTVAVARSRRAKELAIGSFLNVSQAVKFLEEAPDGTAIVCGGTEGRIALEDVLCAGMILYKLWNGPAPESSSDAAHIAFCQYLTDRNRLKEAVVQSNHGRDLIELGFEQDVELCSRVDTHALLPVYRENRLVLSDPSAARVPSRLPATAREE